MKPPVVLAEKRFIVRGRGRDGRFYRKTVELSYGHAKPHPPEKPSHDRMVAAVARILANVWQLETEAPRGRRRVDLIARRDGYSVGFEIKTSWQAFRAETRMEPKKHVPGAVSTNEFYFVLPQEYITHPGNYFPPDERPIKSQHVPADSGLMILTEAGELRIVKPAPRSTFRVP